MRPVVVGPFLLALPVEPRQLRPGRGGDARRRRDPGQPRLIRLARVPAHDAAHRGVGFERRRINPNGAPVHEVGVRQLVQHPGEDRLMRLHVDQPPRARQRRVVRRRLVQLQVQKLPNTQRVGGAPCDGALRVQAFKVAQQQQPEIPPRRQTRATDVVGIERGALRFNERVEARVIEHAVQPRVEGMPGAPREIGRRDPHGRLMVAFSLLTHRHTTSIETEIDSGDRSNSRTFTTGC